MSKQSTQFVAFYLLSPGVFPYSKINLINDKNSPTQKVANNKRRLQRSENFISVLPSETESERISFRSV
jgi:hypothetical protein